MRATRLDGRVAPVALLLLFLALLLGFAATPFLELSRLNDESSESRALLSSLERQIARQRRDPSSAAAQPASLLLAGKTAGIAAANLQKLVNDLVVQTGGKALSFQLLPPQEFGELTRLVLSLSIRVDNGGLRDIVHGAETGTPLIFIDDIAIRAPQGRLQDDGPTPLDVSMQVSGFVLKDGGH
jgi:general secretion pathway protein M